MPDITKIYISRSDKDRAHEEAFRDAMVPAHNIFIWSRGDTLPGTTSAHVMAEQLVASQIFVPLISSTWNADPVCYEESQKAAKMERSGQIIIVPIYLRPCDLSFYPENALPSSERAITEYANTDKAWLEVYRGLKKILDRPQLPEPPRVIVTEIR